MRQITILLKFSLHVAASHFSARTAYAFTACQTKFPKGEKSIFLKKFLHYYCFDFILFF